MSEWNTYRLKSLSQIKGLITTQNRVLIETLTRNEENRTPSGIYMVTDTTFRPAMHTDRISRVVHTPKSLYFNPTPRRRLSRTAPESMPWDTEMELKVGDIVWHDFMVVHNCPIFQVEDQPGKEFKLIPYYDIYVAKRGDETICLNGYNLCEEVMKEKVNELDIISDKEVDQKLGRIAFIAKPNKRYYNSKQSDDGVDIKAGDVIIKRKEDVHIMLEEKIHAKFNGDKMYFLIQRKDIYGKIINDNNS